MRGFLAFLSSCFISAALADHYETLGLARSASSTDIRKAYRSLVLDLHPDKNSSPEATDLFVKVQEAYDVLSDPSQKAHYDVHGDKQPHNSNNHNNYNSHQHTYRQHSSFNTQHQVRRETFGVELTASTFAHIKKGVWLVHVFADGYNYFGSWFSQLSPEVRVAYLSVHRRHLLPPQVLAELNAVVFPCLILFENGVRLSSFQLQGQALFHPIDFAMGYVFSQLRTLPRSAEETASVAALKHYLMDGGMIPPSTSSIFGAPYGIDSRGEYRALPRLAFVGASAWTVTTIAHETREAVSVQSVDTNTANLFCVESGMCQSPQSGDLLFSLPSSPFLIQIPRVFDEEDALSAIHFLFQQAVANPSSYNPASWKHSSISGSVLSKARVYAPSWMRSSLAKADEHSRRRHLSLLSQSPFYASWVPEPKSFKQQTSSSQYQHHHTAVPSVAMASLVSGGQHFVGWLPEHSSLMHSIATGQASFAPSLFEYGQLLKTPQTPNSAVSGSSSSTGDKLMQLTKLPSVTGTTKGSAHLQFVLIVPVASEFVSYVQGKQQQQHKNNVSLSSAAVYSQSDLLKAYLTQFRLKAQTLASVCASLNNNSASEKNDSNEGSSINKMNNVSCSFLRQSQVRDLLRKENDATDARAVNSNSQSIIDRQINNLKKMNNLNNNVNNQNNNSKNRRGNAQASGATMLSMPTVRGQNDYACRKSKPHTTACLLQMDGAFVYKHLHNPVASILHGEDHHEAEPWETPSRSSSYAPVNSSSDLVRALFTREQHKLDYATRTWRQKMNLNVHNVAIETASLMPNDNSSSSSNNVNPLGEEQWMAMWRPAVPEQDSILHRPLFQIVALALSPENDAPSMSQSDVQQTLTSGLVGGDVLVAFESDKELKPTHPVFMAASHNRFENDFTTMQHAAQWGHELQHWVEGIVHQTKTLFTCQHPKHKQKNKNLCVRLATPSRLLEQLMLEPGSVRGAFAWRSKNFPNPLADHYAPSVSDVFDDNLDKKQLFHRPEGLMSPALPLLPESSALRKFIARTFFSSSSGILGLMGLITLVLLGVAVAPLIVMTTTSTNKKYETNTKKQPQQQTKSQPQNNNYSSQNNNTGRNPQQQQQQSKPQQQQQQQQQQRQQRVPQQPQQQSHQQQQQPQKVEQDVALSNHLLERIAARLTRCTPDAARFFQRCRVLPPAVPQLLLSSDQAAKGLHVLLYHSSCVPLAAAYLLAHHKKQLATSNKQFLNNAVLMHQAAWDNPQQCDMNGDAIAQHNIRFASCLDAHMTLDPRVQLWSLDCRSWSENNAHRAQNSNLVMDSLGFFQHKAVAVIIVPKKQRMAILVLRNQPSENAIVSAVLPSPLPRSRTTQKLILADTASLNEFAQQVTKVAEAALEDVSVLPNWGKVGLPLDLSPLDLFSMSL